MRTEEERSARRSYARRKKGAFNANGETRRGPCEIWALSYFTPPRAPKRPLTCLLNQTVYLVVIFAAISNENFTFTFLCNAFTVSSAAINSSTSVPK